MKRRYLRYMVSFILILSILALAACGGNTAETAGETTAVPTPAETKATEASGSRIDTLVSAWKDAGLDAGIDDAFKNATFAALHGSSMHYVVHLDDEQFMVLEYDLENLDSTGEGYLKSADEHGIDLKTDDPVWRNGEFILRNAYSVLEGGEKTAEYQVITHPKSQLIIDTFESFK